MSLLLTEQERVRFADWLELEASTAEGIAGQLGNLPGAFTSMVIDREKRYAAAALLIAGKLRATESVSA